jgi:hypothetical protein
MIFPLKTERMMLAKIFHFINFILFILFILNCGDIESNWHKTQSLNTKEAYENFIKRYPQGQFADSAKIKIAGFQFQEVLQANEIQKYKDFIDSHPIKPFLDSAKSKMKDLIKLKLDSSYAMVSRNNFEAARQLLEAVIMADSTNPATLNNLAVLYAHFGNFEAAYWLLDAAYTRSDTKKVPNVVFKVCIGYGEFATILNIFCDNDKMAQALSLSNLNQLIFVQEGVGFWTKMFSQESNKILLKECIGINGKELLTILNHLKNLPREKWKHQKSDSLNQRGCLCWG